MGRLSFDNCSYYPQVFIINLKPIHYEEANIVACPSPFYFIVLLQTECSR